MTASSASINAGRSSGRADSIFGANAVTLTGARRIHVVTKCAAELAGRIGGELARVGRPIGLADTTIAAFALDLGLELVTGNTAHFQRVQQLGYPLTLFKWRF